MEEDLYKPQPRKCKSEVTGCKWDFDDSEVI